VSHGGKSIAVPRTSVLLSRSFDVLASTCLLAIATPVIAVIAIMIRCLGRGPVVFTQLRVGQGGQLFRMHKFRTLRPVGEPNPTVTPTGDARVSGVGAHLRRLHLDELPQLLDVLAGRMALVGPRPELPENLREVDATALAAVLSMKPGWTGPTQLKFIAEDDVLAAAPDPVHAYRHVLVPAKVRNDLTWMQARSLSSDIAILLRTPLLVVSRKARARSRQFVQKLLDSGAQRFGGRQPRPRLPYLPGTTI
jgi:lipopolysaccharide/colanic/teichoic acid biosynthesis glycosyltransferase